jgi:glycosyltransferase involved in cell wall biosynthesis
MHGQGTRCLSFGLETIARQSYPSLEVVVSDHSRDESIARLCDSWANRLSLRYLRNERHRGSSSANANNALENAQGDLIKILCQDDYLADDGAIERTVAALGAGDNWLVSSYGMTTDRASFRKVHVPSLTADIALVNSIGTHSCLTIRNLPEMELFDERLIWFMDCEYYRRLYDRYGAPVILDDPTVVQLTWEGQVTNTYAASRRLRRAERRIVKERHPTPAHGLPRASTRRVPSRVSKLLGRD